MGLAEKRAIAEYQQKDFPEIKKQIDEAAGTPVEMEIRWDTLAAEGQASRYPDWFKKVYFTPLIDALKAIGVDEMGKGAIKSGLKKVVVDGTTGSSYSNFKMDGGILTLQHKSDSNVDDVSERTKGLTKLLEQKLG